MLQLFISNWEQTTLFMNNNNKIIKQQPHLITIIKTYNQIFKKIITYNIIKQILKIISKIILINKLIKKGQ